MLLEEFQVSQWRMVGCNLVAELKANCVSCPFISVNINIQNLDT